MKMTLEFNSLEEAQDFLKSWSAAFSPKPITTAEQEFPEVSKITIEGLLEPAWQGAFKDLWDPACQGSPVQAEQPPAAAAVDDQAQNHRRPCGPMRICENCGDSFQQQNGGKRVQPFCKKPECRKAAKNRMQKAWLAKKAKIRLVDEEQPAGAAPLAKPRGRPSSKSGASRSSETSMPPASGPANPGAK